MIRPPCGVCPFICLTANCVVKKHARTLVAIMLSKSEMGVSSMKGSGAAMPAF